MDKDILSFTKVKINPDLIDEIWKFDPRKLGDVSGEMLSTYNIALAQYLVYFTYQRNLVKAEVYRLNKLIDRTVSLILAANKNILKEHKTKTSAADYLISTNTNLMDEQAKLDMLITELSHIDGIDKAVSEFIATIKRELTRRENELYTVRMERK